MGDSEKSINFLPMNCLYDERTCEACRCDYTKCDGVLFVNRISYEKLHSYTNEKDYIDAIEEAGNILQQETGAQVIITGINPPSADGDKHFIGNMYLDGNKTFYRTMPL